MTQPRQIRYAAPGRTWYSPVMRFVCLFLCLSACTGANHLGNPLTLPLRGLASAAENAAYGARRARVSETLAQIGPDGLPASQDQLWAVAPVPDVNKPKVLREITALSDGPDWVERATVIVMVHLP